MRPRPSWLDTLPDDATLRELLEPERLTLGPGVPDTRGTAFANAIACGNVPFAIWLDELSRSTLNWGERLVRLMKGRLVPADVQALLVGAQLAGWVTLGVFGPTRQQKATHANVADFTCWSFRPGVCTEEDCRMPDEALAWIDRMRPLFVLELADRIGPRRATCVLTF